MNAWKHLEIECGDQHINGQVVSRVSTHDVHKLSINDHSPVRSPVISGVMMSRGKIDRETIQAKSHYDGRSIPPNAEPPAATMV